MPLLDPQAMYSFGGNQFDWLAVSANPDGSAKLQATGKQYLPQVTVLGSVVVGNAPTWLEAAGNVLYCTETNGSRVKSFDISNGIPVFLGQVTVGTNTGHLRAKGKWLYATDLNGAQLRVIDVSNPAAMTVNNTLVVDASGAGMQARFDIQQRGRYALIGGPSSGANVGKANVVDLADPTAPVVVGTTINIGTTHRGVVYIGNNAFALASRDDAKVKIIDISTPAAPAVAATITTTQSNTTTPLTAQGNYLYVGNYGNGTTGGLEIWDVSVPAAPRLCSTLAITGGCEHLIVRGGLLYVSCRPTTAGNVFLVIDIRNPALPVQKLSYSIGADTTYSIALANGVIYRTSSEINGSSVGVIYAMSMTTDLSTRLAAIEDALATRWAP